MGLGWEYGRWTIDDLRRNAGRAGGRAILHLDIGPGHYAIFEGFDGDKLILTDPWNDTERAWEAGPEELLRVWHGLILLVKRSET